ncbi:MAG: class I SAM-dependent methyltransferase [Phaeospirillum sp.]|nr:class I SAM-dependent methyltransferase [Phaeospirillum sp.]
MGIQAFFRQVIAAIGEADRDGLVSDKGSDVLGGLSGRATVGLLQRLVGLVEDRNSLCYLEIGVFQGLSLLSVAIEHPEFVCFGIDNFSILDPKGENLGIVQDRTRRLKAVNAHLINRDYEAALEHLSEHIGDRKVAVFFIDGAHDYRSQLMALLLIRPYLAERAVVIVDDANYFDVRQSTRDFLVSHPEFKMVFEAYSPGHPANLDDATRETHEAGWLNGVNVLVLDHSNVLPVMLPRVEPLARDLYVNEWLAHRHRYAELAPQALDLAAAALNGGDMATATARLAEAYAKDKPTFDSRLSDRNLHCEGLPERRFTEWK